MFKQERLIFIGGAILALMALAGLTMVAFAQGKKEAPSSAPSPGLNFDILDGDQLGSVALDPAFQEPAGDLGASKFIHRKMRENLAQALDITPEELDEARWTAFLATLDDGVEEGYLAQKAADRMVAQAIIRRTADREELIAAGLGISVAELQAAREQGKTPRQLATELGLDGQAIGQNLATALEQLLQQAAEDGLIDDVRLERILDDDLLERLAQGQWRPWLRQQRPRHLRDLF